MPRTLTQEEVDRYYEQGYLVLHDVIPQEILDAARAETDRMVAVASTLTEAIPMLDLDPSHTPEKPRVRRIKSPHEHSEYFRALAGDATILDVLDPLMPSGVRIHNTKVNMKSAGVGESIEWHQDWAFYPHTNDDVLAALRKNNDRPPVGGNSGRLQQPGFDGQEEGRHTQDGRGQQGLRPLPLVTPLRTPGRKTRK